MAGVETEAPAAHRSPWHSRCKAGIQSGTVVRGGVAVVVTVLVYLLVRRATFDLSTLPAAAAAATSTHEALTPAARKLLEDSPHAWGTCEAAWRPVGARHQDVEIGHPDAPMPLHSGVFVLGCGHSGTSLVTRMLGAHSRLWNYPGETSMLEGTAEMQKGLEGKARWVEKTPDHVFQLSRLFESYPEARVIHMLRDARDVVASVVERGYSPADGVRRWRAALVAGAEWWHDPRVLVVRYEELVSRPAMAMACILAFLGEPWDEAVLHYHATHQYWYTDPLMAASSRGGAGAGGSSATSAVAAGTLAAHNAKRDRQINTPIYQTSVGRWRTDLEASTVASVISELGWALETLQYHDGHDPDRKSVGI